MSNFIQLHVLTPNPVSNPNRDDLGLPKTALVGGTLRGRKSSQNSKRVIRTSGEMQALGIQNLGVRTKHVGALVSDHLIKQGVAAEMADRAARSIVKVLENKTEKAETAPASKAKAGKAGSKGAGKGKATAAAPLDLLAGVARAEVAEAAPDATAAAKPDEAGDASLDMGQLVFLSQAEIGRIQTAAEEIARGGAMPAFSDLLLHADTAVDVAMFGRMMAAIPSYNREAAVQVSHAITTHKAVVEDDYFTAMDDLNARSDSGAAHLGERAFISGIFYQYVTVDFTLLVANLGGNVELANQALSAFMKALVSASSPGMQASYASRTQAAYVLVERGDDQPFTGATAFDKAVSGDDLLTESIKRLREQRALARRRYCLEHDVFEFAPDDEHTIKDLLGFVTKSKP